MRWQGGRRSTNVNDRRGIGGPVAVGGGIIGVIVLVLNFLMGGGGDISQLPLPGAGGGQSTQLSPEQQAAQDKQADFVASVLGYTEDVWREQFQQQLGQNYAEPQLDLFTGSVQSGCGGATAQSGPFYCPADRKVYIDLSFYQELQDRFGAPGDFAMAYVIAHEVGHHIQTLLGTSQKVAQLRGQVSQEEYNQYSVRLELQADFLAGVWAHYLRNKKTTGGLNVLEAGDYEEAMNAANAIGDDRLQREATGRVNPESFTHGTSRQRMYWFNKGYTTGDMRQGDTFSASRLE
jgi:predicted metalloprotease